MEAEESAEREQAIAKADDLEKRTRYNLGGAYELLAEALKRGVDPNFLSAEDVVVKR